ncbi:MAG: hypothetical protein U0802_03275 [Candidatus Binatia bacterium]
MYARSAVRPVTAADIAGMVVLETYRVNLGWSYELKGMFIDGNGDVWAYEQHGTPWYPEKLKTGEVSERDLLTKHKGAQRIGTVDLPMLVEMANQIRGAAKGPVTRAHPEHEGSGSLDVAYILDKPTHTYTEVVLSGTGDLTATNGSGEARALLDYLREVEQTVGYDPDR